MNDLDAIKTVALAAGLGPQLASVPLTYTGKSIQPVDVDSAAGVCAALAEQIAARAGFILSPWAKGGYRIGVFGKSA